MKDIHFHEFEGCIPKKSKEDVEEQSMQYLCSIQAICFDLFVAMEDLSTTNVTTQQTHHIEHNICY